MLPVTEAQIRASFANASKREASQATLPDLETIAWDRLDYLGWRDRKSPLLAYAVVPVAATDGGDGTELVGVLLRSTERRADAPRRKTVCAWCEDVVKTDDVTLYVARRGGAAGKKGDTIGTLICTDFTCSANVRRRPTSAEAGGDVEEARELFVALRVEGLRERSARFAVEVRRTR
ncbi:translation elongation factor [Serinibacter arcticus]|uniref:Translation elongation factor n=1 Tax=Serinibacter arcticus TaxID=1655435 RepID=A0A2U1ZVK6_9MICO|nr:FBP domain-containing protein [Serinibacter arcticus]PWD51027.1 translation elongation factor [Serinibacter arcticus]